MANVKWHDIEDLTPFELEQRIEDEVQRRKCMDSDTLLREQVWQEYNLNADFQKMKTELAAAEIKIADLESDAYKLKLIINRDIYKATVNHLKVRICTDALQINWQQLSDENFRDKVRDGKAAIVAKYGQEFADMVEVFLHFAVADLKDMNRLTHSASRRCLVVIPGGHPDGSDKTVKSEMLELVYSMASLGLIKDPAKRKVSMAMLSAVSDYDRNVEKTIYLRPKDGSQLEELNYDQWHREEHQLTEDECLSLGLDPIYASKTPDSAV